MGIFPCAVNYLGMGEGWKWNGTQSAEEGFAMFDFPEPQDIARFAIEWRDSNHSPTNFSLVDQNGIFFSTNQPTGFSGNPDRRHIQHHEGGEIQVHH